MELLHRVQEDRESGPTPVPSPNAGRTPEFGEGRFAGCLSLGYDMTERGGS